MGTDLDMMQLSDSLFPAGAFAMSNGLEGMHASGKIRTPKELAGYMATCIRQQIGTCDCVVLLSACKSASSADMEGIATLDGICFAAKTIRESRDASCRSGNQMLKCVAGLCPDDVILGSYAGRVRDGALTGVHPVSLAVCCNALGIGAEKAALVMLYGFASSTVGAALRLGIIQHLEGQSIIHGLKPLMTGIAKSAAGTPVRDIWQFAPLAEICQMAHERSEYKMFIT